MVWPAIAAAAGGALLGGAYSKLGQGKNPSKAAGAYLQQLPGIGKQYYDPYITAGRAADERTQGEYDKLLSDPGNFLDAIMAQYEPSKAYKYKSDTLSRALANTAASGGYRGSEYNQRQQAELINDLLGTDMQQYLGNYMDIYNRGLGGYEGISNRGMQASGALADYIGNAMGAQAGNAYQGQLQKNINRRHFIDSIIGGGMQGLGMYNGMTGGGMSGGAGGGGWNDLSSFYGTSWNSPLSQARSSRASESGLFR